MFFLVTWLRFPWVQSRTSWPMMTTTVTNMENPTRMRDQLNMGKQMGSFSPSSSGTPTSLSFTCFPELKLEGNAGSSWSQVIDFFFSFSIGPF